ncbi:hypothetical protein IWX48DRAFT_68890 [Phyllosticta citricarpa]
MSGCVRLCVRAWVRGYVLTSQSHQQQVDFRDHTTRGAAMARHLTHLSDWIDHLTALASSTVSVTLVVVGGGGEGGGAVVFLSFRRQLAANDYLTGTSTASFVVVLVVLASSSFVVLISGRPAGRQTVR